MNERSYKYKLDFYYKSLALYLLTLLVYILIKGRFFQERFEIVFRDPIIYVISLFILYFVVLLIANYVSARQIIFGENDIVIKNRFGQRTIEIKDILAIRFTRPRRKVDDNISTSRIAKLKLKDRRRLLRIRLSDFQNEKQLESEFRAISKKITPENWKHKEGR